jgi:hypothetical protein
MERHHRRNPCPAPRLRVDYKGRQRGFASTNAQIREIIEHGRHVVAERNANHADCYAQLLVCHQRAAAGCHDEGPSRLKDVLLSRRCCHEGHTAAVTSATEDVVGGTVGKIRTMRGTI